jgi:hypothetical protein
MALVGGLAVLAVILNLHHLWKPRRPPGLPIMPAGTEAPPPKQAGPAELALVAPLKVGSSIEGYDVLAVYGIENGNVWVVVGKGEHTGYFAVAKSGPGVPAPFTAGPYSVYYALGQFSGEDAMRLIGAFNPMIKANVAVPVPPGLGPYDQSKPLPRYQPSSEAPAAK